MVKKEHQKSGYRILKERLAQKEYEISNLKTRIDRAGLNKPELRWRVSVKAFWWQHMSRDQAELKMGELAKMGISAYASIEEENS